MRAEQKKIMTENGLRWRVHLWCRKYQCTYNENNMSYIAQFKKFPPERIPFDHVSGVIFDSAFPYAIICFTDSLSDELEDYVERHRDIIMSETWSDEVVPMLKPVEKKKTARGRRNGKPSPVISDSKIKRIEAEVLHIMEHGNETQKQIAERNCVSDSYISQVRKRLTSHMK